MATPYVVVNKDSFVIATTSTKAAAKALGTTLRAQGAPVYVFPLAVWCDMRARLLHAV